MVNSRRSFYLIERHLHGKALIVFIGHCGPIHIQQDKGAVVCDDTPPLLVDLLQVVFAEPASDGPSLLQVMLCSAST